MKALFVFTGFIALTSLIYFFFPSDSPIRTSLNEENVFDSTIQQDNTNYDLIIDVESYPSSFDVYVNDIQLATEKSATPIQFGSAIPFLYREKPNTLVVQFSQPVSASVKISRGDDEVLCSESLTTRQTFECVFTAKPAYTFSQLAEQPNLEIESISYPEILKILQNYISQPSARLAVSRYTEVDQFSTEQFTKGIENSQSAIFTHVANFDRLAGSSVNQNAKFPENVRFKVYFQINPSTNKVMPIADTKTELYGLGILQYNDKIFYTGLFNKRELYFVLSETAGN